MDFGERSDLQLLRVSKGAHELKKMIDYWSKSSNSNGQQKHIFNDLLRGAMELQESLLMLSKLQKASRKMSMKKKGQSEREEVAEENSIDLIRYKRLQEHRLSADNSSTKYTQEMKQVIKDRFKKFDNEKVSSTKNSILSKNKVDFSAQAKKKAPNLIAKLMGLENFPLDDQIEVGKDENVLRRSKSHVVRNKSLDEIIETMRSTGFLNSEQSVSLMTKSNFIKKDEVPPIVIMKSLNFPYREREEVNLISETSDLILEDRVSDTDTEFSENLEQSEVMSIENEKIEPLQKLKSAIVIKERKMTDDLKKMEINGKKQVEKKLKGTIEPMNMNSSESRKGEKLQATSRFTSQTNKSNEENRKDKFPMKSESFNSISSVKEEKISTGRLVRKSNKTEDKKSKEGNLNSTLTERHAISRSKSILAPDSLLKQAQKEPTKPFKKGEIRKDHKVICEVMPRNYQAGRSLEMFEDSNRKYYHKAPTKNAAEIKLLLIPLLLSSHSFSNHKHDHFGTNIIKPAFYQTTFLEEHEIVYDQLLLDCAKELMTRKSCEDELSIHQMMQKKMENQLSYRSFNYLLEEISNGIQKLESYSDFDDDSCYEDRLDCILEKDLHCNETFLNVIWDDGWDDWICVKEVDKVVIELSERIFFRLLLEVAKDLI